MSDNYKWTEADALMVDAMLVSDAYQFLLDTYVREHAARLTTALAGDCDWDKVQKIRGELAALGHFSSAAIRKKYPTQSDKP